MRVEEGQHWQVGKASSRGTAEEKSKHVNAGPTLSENTPTWVQYWLNARQATA